GGPAIEIEVVPLEHGAQRRGENHRLVIGRHRAVVAQRHCNCRRHALLLPVRPARASVARSRVAELVAGSLISAAAGWVKCRKSSMPAGLPMIQPWTSSHRSALRKLNSPLVSTPSASTGNPRPRPRPRTARTIAAASPLTSIVLMKDRSILILSNGNDLKFDNDE